MTIDIRVANVPDLFIGNEIMNLSRMHFSEGFTLAGINCSIVGQGEEALLPVFRFIYAVIGRKIPDYSLWLFIGNSAWQPDTRIVRYRKLWGALAARGINVSHIFSKQEVMCESNGKLKFFGAVQLSELSVQSVVQLLLEERCAYLAALPSSIGPEDILNLGWSGELVEDSKVIECLVKRNGLLIKRTGEFDDEERGAIIIGIPELVRSLIG